MAGTHFVFGTAGYIKFGTTVLSVDMRNFQPDEEVGTVDQSSGNDTSRTYLTTLKDGKSSLEILLQPGGTAVWAATAPGTAGTLEWGEEGTAIGKPKHSVNAIVKSRKRAMPYDGVVTATIDFQFSSATGVTDGTY